MHLTVETEREENGRWIAGVPDLARVWDRAARRLIIGAALLAACAGPLVTGGPAANPSPTPTGERIRGTTRAIGTFEVKLTPQPADAYADGSILGRMTIDKQFQGDLQATSRGQMLSGMASVKGSAGYVAIERVSGALGGRRGTFVLQHSGIMARGTPTLTITVVPDSGTDELAGLTGTMTIDVASGQHSYTFDYTLPPAP